MGLNAKVAGVVLGTGRHTGCGSDCESITKNPPSGGASRLWRGRLERAAIRRRQASCPLRGVGASGDAFTPIAADVERHLLGSRQSEKLGTINPAIQEVDAMNIRSGLFRAWLVLSIAWIAYCLWHSILVCPLNRIGIHTPDALGCRFSEVDLLPYYSNLVLKMFGIPALVLVALAAADWVWWRGFRSAPEKSRTRDSA
jgi:hypothetical protein